MRTKLVAPNFQRSQKLIAYLVSSGISQIEVAKHLALTQSTVSRRISNEGFSDLEIDRLEQIFGETFKSVGEKLEGCLILRREEDLTIEKIGVVRGFVVFFLSIPGSGSLILKGPDEPLV